MNKIIHPIEPEELMAYLDGALTTERVNATAAHLGECAECQGLVSELRKVSQDLKSWEVEPLESTITPAIATAIVENRPASRRVFPARRSWREVRWLTVAWVGGVAAILLLAAVSTPNLMRSRKAINAFDQRDVVRLSPSAPSAAPMNGRQFDRIEQFAKLRAAPPVSSTAPQSDHASVENNLPANGPMIIRTAQLSVVTQEFDKARANLEAILKRHRGYVGELKTGGSTGSGRTLTATLRVPADQLDATLAEVKTLGRVESESQSGQDVTSQYVDLQARLSNARNTEQRLIDLLKQRTGKLADVLEVETEL